MPESVKGLYGGKVVISGSVVGASSISRAVRQTTTSSSSGLCKSDLYDAVLHGLKLLSPPDTSNPYYEKDPSPG